MVVYRHPSGFFSESRCTIEKWHSQTIDPSKDINPHTGKKGIRTYNLLTALFLSLFSVKIQVVQAGNGKRFYLNRKSYAKWKQLHGLIPSKSRAHKAAKKTENARRKAIKPRAGIIEQKELISQIRKVCGKEISDAWAGLLSQIPSRKIGKIERKENGNITVAFQSPATLWLDSRNGNGESDPPGGTVILLGHNKNSKMEFAFDGSHRTMKINSGVDFWCDTPLGVRKVDVMSIQPAGANRIHLLAGVNLSFLGLKTRVKKFKADRMVIVWSQATYLNSTTNYKNYLKHKADLA